METITEVHATTQHEPVSEDDALPAAPYVPAAPDVEVQMSYLPIVGGLAGFFIAQAGPLGLQPDALNLALFALLGVALGQLARPTAGRLWGQLLARLRIGYIGPGRLAAGLTGLVFGLVFSLLLSALDLPLYARLPLALILCAAGGGAGLILWHEPELAEVRPHGPGGAGHLEVRPHGPPGHLSDPVPQVVTRSGAAGTAPPKVLDTSAIIDGRIAVVTESGFLDGVFLVPQFVLSELQHIADSPDPHRRRRGRRGLDILNRLRQGGALQIVADDYPDIPEVDHKLVRLAEDLGAKLVTGDLNLNKVAKVQGVRVLNVNELADALRPVVLPEEEMTVTIVKRGRERNQGLAYLADGTMVVIDNAANRVGESVSVVVNGLTQTSAGRLIFARLNK